MDQAEIDKQRLRLFDLSADLFCIAGYDGYFKDLSPSWSTTLGYSLAELRARPFVEFVHPDDIAATNEEAKRLEDDAVTISFENRYRHRDGGYRLLHWTSRGHKESQRLYAVARDVTDIRSTQSLLRDSELKLANSQKLASLGRMSAGIAHEINNPLQVVKGYTGQLRSILASLEDPKISKSLDMIDRNCQRMENIVKQMSAYSRIASGAFEIVSVNEVVRGVVQQLTDAMPSAIGIDIDLCTDATTVMGSYQRIEQLLVNLVTNSRDALEECGRSSAISLRTVRDGDKVNLSVVDKGSGIEPLLIPKIFDPFFTTKAPGSGTGLGLSIVHEIVQEIAGNIDVESTVGSGTAITIQLQFAAA